MSSDVSIKKFEKDILRELKNNNLNIFAGAGLSRGSGFVDWKELLKDVALELNLDINKENDLVSLAQYHYNDNGRHTINESIVSEFQRGAKENETMHILASLPINTFWTTNYDSIIEDTLANKGKIVDVKKESSQMKFFKPNRDVLVYKMHGDKDNPNKAVITRDDYESYSKYRSAFTTQLKGELLSKMFLFIGFSFEDPNLEQILSKIRVDLIEDEDTPKTHYCFFRRVNKNDERYLLSNGEYDEAAYKYDEIKQELKLKDLKRYGIHTVLVDKHSEITEIMKNIENKLKLNKIFISGSAHVYGDYNEDQAKDLLHSLSANLVNNNNHITSGFGLGVGSYVINGALEVGYKKNLKTDNYLTLRPFPQKESGDKTIYELWNEYRIDVIKNNGIGIFVFGNKLKNDKVVTADGILKEFEIALKHGLYIIPISSTGYATEEIMKEIEGDVETYWYLQGSIENLKTSRNKEVLITEVNNIINRLT
ncbi:SIR2 family protein [Staphylococcus xylosus]|uniref:SIR2 family protein n=1 Tax=Staphylococcus xylosus TaxID=1288 RepID=UPI003F56864D